MRGRQKPEIHESADFLVAGWRHSTSPSLSLSLPLNLCRGQTSISRGKRDGGRGAHYVSVIGRIQPCFQFAQRRRLCNSQKRADVLFEGTNNCSWFHKVGGFCARTATRNLLLRDDVIDDRDNADFEVENLSKCRNFNVFNTTWNTIDMRERDISVPMR